MQCPVMIGWQEFESIQDHIVPPTHPVYSRVVNVVKKIVDSNQDLEFMREQTWTIVVIDSNEVNAFVLPVCVSSFFNVPPKNLKFVKTTSTKYLTELTTDVCLLLHLLAVQCLQGLGDSLVQHTYR